MFSFLLFLHSGGDIFLRARGVLGVLAILLLPLFLSGRLLLGRSACSVPAFVVDSERFSSAVFSAVLKVGASTRLIRSRAARQRTVLALRACSIYGVSPSSFAIPLSLRNCRIAPLWVSSSSNDGSNSSRICSTTLGSIRASLGELASFDANTLTGQRLLSKQHQTQLEQGNVVRHALLPSRSGMRRQHQTEVGI